SIPENTFLSDAKTTDGFIGLKLAPNPTTNILNIYGLGKNQEKQVVTLSIISASGVLIKTTQVANVNQVMQVDVSTLARGVYTIKIVTFTKTMSAKFIKL